MAGFTLVELMITVAVVAILAAVALPGYASYVRRSNRSDAQGFLSEVAARQQHFLLDRRSFAISVTDAPAANGMGMTIPASVAARYAVRLVTDNAARPPVFTVIATPTGSQVADNCGTLRINQAGAKSATGTGSCW
ncbi:MAG: type IV pilin protein [Rubrivivax sp.]